MSKSDDPPFLPVGTDVSSKFKGAFCESKVLDLEKKITVKLSLKEASTSTMQVPHTDLPAGTNLKAGQMTTITVNKRNIKCQIVHVKDMSRYHVGFGDGDEKWLRRTQLLPQGSRHFAADGNLDAMPLTNPEAFSAPVSKKPKNDTDPSTSRRDEDDEDEENAEGVPGDDGNETEDVGTPLIRERRRAAENARNAIEDLTGAINDTVSEESADDDQPSTSTAKPKKRRRLSTEDDDPEGDGKEGVEEDTADDDATEGGADEAEEDVDDDDEDGSTLANGSRNSVDPSGEPKVSKREKKKAEKQAEKEEKQRQKEEEREQKARRKEEEKERKKQEKLKLVEKKRLEKLFRSAIDARNKHHQKVMNRTMLHKSFKYSLTHRTHRKFKHTEYVDHVNEEGVTERLQAGTFMKGIVHKTYARRETMKVRNCVLFMPWKTLVNRIKAKFRCRYVRQWLRIEDYDKYGIIRSNKLLRRKKRREMVRAWLKGVERNKRVQFVVYHEDHTLVRKIINYAEKDLDEKITFQQRCDLSYEDVDSKNFYTFALTQEWYPAVLFPEVYTDESGSVHNRRVIRHMVTGELLKVWEDDLIPFNWLPEFHDRETKSIVEKRPKEHRSRFLLSFLFSNDYHLDKFHLGSLYAMLKCRRRDLDLVPKKASVPIRPRFIAVPSPSKRNEPEDMSLDDSNHSDDYDSDASIKNVTQDIQDMFLARLMEFHDTRPDSKLDTSPTIQGEDVNLYYMYQLAARIGAPKKVYTAKPWTTWARKLVPNAVEAEEDIKEIFSNSIEPYLFMNAKLNVTFETSQPTNERKIVLPGQYSENRKKREKALFQQVKQKSPDAPDASTSNHVTPPGRGGPARNKKRKAGSPESVSSKKRGSRNHTLSPELDDIPGPSNAVYSGDEDQDGDEKRKKSKRRSRDPGPTPKKGRPRKHPRPSEHSPERGRRKDEVPESELIRANVISHPKQSDYINAYYVNTWFPGQCVGKIQDISAYLLKTLLKQQAKSVTELTPYAKHHLDRIFSFKNTKVHYSGWNNRYDVWLSFEKIRVIIKDQARARQRLQKLPDGMKLRPETLALVEAAYCKEDRPEQKPDYLALARSALGNVFEDFNPADYEESDYDENDKVIEATPPKTTRPRRVNTAAEDDGTEADDEGDDGPDEEGVRAPHPDVQDDDDPEDDASVSDSAPADDNVPDYDDVRSDDIDSLDNRDRSSTPSSTSIVSSERRPQSARSSTSQAALSPRRSPALRESDSPELGDPTSSSSDQKDSGSASGSMSPEREEPQEEAPEVVQQEPEPASGQNREAESDASRVTIQDLESENDEPDYPVVPRTPEQNLQESVEEAAEPIAEQLNDSGGSYKSLSRQGSSNPIPVFSTTTPLAHSGPLVLEEVPPTTTTATSSLEDVSPSGEIPKRRRMSSGTDSVTSTRKRPRRASERSSGAEEPTITRGSIERSTLFTSGALTLEMTQPSSGPIEPMLTPSGSIQRGGRRKTASPTLISSGPLTMYPSPQQPSTSSTPKVRPPGAPPLGRPKKVSSAGPSSRKTEEEEEKPMASSPPKENSVQVEPVPMETSEGSSSPTDEKDDESGTPPRSNLGQFIRGGKRKRGNGRPVGFQKQNNKPPGLTKKDQKDSEEGNEDAPSIPTPFATPSRPDSFAQQKTRMAKAMEEDGILNAYHLLDEMTDHEKVLADAPPEDVNSFLEEMGYEAREMFYGFKSEISALEKALKKSEAQRKKMAEVAAEPAPAPAPPPPPPPIPPQPSSDDQPSTSSTPPSNPQPLETE